MKIYQVLQSVVISGVIYNEAQLIGDKNKPSEEIVNDLIQRGVVEEVPPEERGVIESSIADIEKVTKVKK